MQEEIPKHLKVIHRCKNCRKKITKRVIVGTKKDFSVSDLTFAFYNSPANLKSCGKCKASDFEVSYSFYHQEKISN